MSGNVNLINMQAKDLYTLAEILLLVMEYTSNTKVYPRGGWIKDIPSQAAPAPWIYNDAESAIFVTDCVLQQDAGVYDALDTDLPDGKYAMVNESTTTALTLSITADPGDDISIPAGGITIFTKVAGVVSGTIS